MQVPDPKPHRATKVQGRLCPGAWCEITGVRRECLESKKHRLVWGLGGESREQARQGPPLESRLWVLLSGGAGVSWGLEAGARAM